MQTDPHPFDLTKVRLQAEVFDSLEPSTLPSYMRSPVANPVMASKCSGSRVQVDAVTRCVGRECGLMYAWVGSPELLSVARLARLAKAGGQ